MRIPTPSRVGWAQMRTDSPVHAGQPFDNLSLFDPPTGAPGGFFDLDAMGETTGEVGEVGDDADPATAWG